MIVKHFLGMLCFAIDYFTLYQKLNERRNFSYALHYEIFSRSIEFSDNFKIYFIFWVECLVFI